MPGAPGDAAGTRSVDRALTLLSIICDRGAMGLVVDLRNGLAHGRLSFAECGQGVTVSDLSTLSDRIFLYLREVVAAFERCVGSEHYLRPAARAQGAA